MSMNEKSRVARVYFDKKDKPVGVGEVIKFETKAIVRKRPARVVQTMRIGTGKLTDNFRELSKDIKDRIDDPDDAMKLSDLSLVGGELKVAEVLDKAEDSKP